MLAQSAGVGNSQAIIALVAAALSGMLVKGIDLFINRDNIKVDEAVEIREELRQEARNQRIELEEAKQHVDYWRGMYMELLVDYERLKLEMELLKIETGD